MGYAVEPTLSIILMSENAFQLRGGKLPGGISRT